MPTGGVRSGAGVFLMGRRTAEGSHPYPLPPHLLVRCLAVPWSKPKGFCGVAEAWPGAFNGKPMMTPKRPPNVLFILTDQQRADSLSCLGAPSGLTPHLDRLAAEGTLFERAYCTQPVCTPSRASLMTGQWPHRHGCIENNDRLPESFPSLAECAPEGYRTGYFGKWHLGDELVAQRGFERWLSLEDAIYRPYFSKPEYLELRSDYHHFLVRQGLEPDQKTADGAMCFNRGTVARLPEPLTKAHFVADAVAEACRAHDRQHPFFWVASIFEPHSPFTSCHDDDLDPEELPVGPAFAQMPPENHSLRNRLRAEALIAGRLSGTPGASAAELRAVRARYLGVCRMVDAAIGKILAALRETGLEEETIVVFTSDHGEMMGDHHTLLKGLLYEEAVRVPLIVRVPGGGGRRVSTPVSLIDLAPTLLEAMGSEQAVADLPGRSLLGATKGETLEPRDVVVQWNSRPGGSTSEAASERGEAAVSSQQWRSLITPEGWKLNTCATDQDELFHLSEDPYEQINRIDDPASSAIRNELALRLRRWQKKENDSLNSPSPS